MKKGGGLNFGEKSLKLLRYKILMFLSVGPHFKEGVRGFQKDFVQKLKFWGFFQLRWPLTIVMDRTIAQ